MNEKQGRTKKFFYNSLTTAFLQVVTMIIGFILPRVMLQSYGSEINGLVSSITQFVSYFNLVEAGLGAAATYALYKPLAEKNHTAISSIVTAANRFYNISGYVFVTLTLGLAIIYPVFIKTSSLSLLEVALLVIILGTKGALEFFTLGKYRALLSADQKTYIISLASIVEIVVNCIIIVWLAYSGFNIVLVRFAALFSVFLRSIILWIYSRKHYRYINYKEKPNNEALNKRWSALYLQILGAVHIGAPVVLATIFTDLKTVSVFAVFNMVIAGVNGVLGIFNSGLSASFGDVIARKEEKILQKSFKEFQTAFYAILSVVYGVTMIMIMPFINIYTYNIMDADYNQPILGFLMVLNGLLYNLKTPQGMLVISAGLYQETKWQTTIQGLIELIGGIILVQWFGINGIMIASILSNIYRDIDLLFFIPKWVTHLPVKDTMFRMFRVLLIITAICIPVVLNWITIDISGYFSWIKYAIMVTFYACLITGCISFIFDWQSTISLVKRLKFLKR